MRAYKNDSKKIFSLPDFITILSKIPKNVRIDFSGMSESWLNKDCTNMLEHTLKLGFNVAIYSTLYGMTKEDGDRVYELIIKHTSQIKVFCIHLPDASNNMRGWKNSEAYRYVLKKFLDFPPDIKKTIKLETMTMDKNNNIHPELNDLNIELTNRDWVGHTRGGNLTIFALNEFQLGPIPVTSSPVECYPSGMWDEKIGLSSAYDHNILIPNGNVLLCCMDYSSNHILGNLLRQSYEELRQSNTIKNVIELNKTSHYIPSHICKNCVSSVDCIKISKP
jgi:hypothetical protein